MGICMHALIVLTEYKSSDQDIIPHDQRIAMPGELHLQNIAAAIHHQAQDVTHYLPIQGMHT